MSYLSPVRRPWLFLSLSLLVHGAVAGGAVFATRLADHGLPAAPAATSLKSDTETELPLGEAPGEAEVAPTLMAEAPAPPAPSPEPGAETAVPPRPTAASSARRAQPTAPPSPGAPGAGAGAQPGLIGAVGEPGAVELETAFLRALPQVASFDKDWNREPIGTTFAATITVDLDEKGHLAQLTGVSGSTPLNRAIERALGQLKPRLLTARALRTRITITCTVHTDEVHDGWHGDVFALGATANGRGGTGFVSLATGRRVDFVVTAR